MKKLSNSVPYLVPRASILLQDIGRNFFDSLQVKNIPLNKLLVTSVLRTKEDIKNLQKHNGNATEKVVICTEQPLILLITNIEQLLDLLEMIL